MKYVLLIALLAFGGYYVHKRMKTGSEAVEAYKTFTADLFYCDYNKAKAGTVGTEPSAEIERRRIQQEYYQRIGDFGQIKQIDYKVKSETYSPDKQKVDLTLFQDVFCGRKQMMSSMASTHIYYNHTAQMVKTDTGWKVASFQFTMADPKPAAGNLYTGLE